ncbi:hypothetical protein KQH49_09420 [Mycetohabitans sp. B5]|uniref:hypothetical protein n=1 Tax=Mycetohabitans TaxID=2571159 RepID=UPI001304ACE2|nr:MULTISPECIES: hypothetical protein [Mycetohabitans]MCG1055152.1 hypothetical protein [Mycetohabitans sp. B5]
MGQAFQLSHRAAACLNLFFPRVRQAFNLAVVMRMAGRRRLQPRWGADQLRQAFTEIYC